MASVTLVDPVSPFGFGGTRGVEGRLCDPAGAGSGGGTGNPEFVARLAAGDRGGGDPLSPRQVLLAHYVKPPFVPEHLDIFVESMLSTRIGDDHYPGDSRPAAGWPGIAPGDHGVLNTMAPTHFRIEDLSGLRPGQPILWLRGADDVIVSDASLYDLAYLGSVAAVPGWPGEQPGRRSRWCPRPGACWTGTRPRAAGTARWSSRSPGTGRTWTSRRSSGPRWSSTWLVPDGACGAYEAGVAAGG